MSNLDKPTDNTSPALITKIYESGVVFYICSAKPGTALVSALWRVKKIDTGTDITITWADGNANFDNVATDLATVALLSYS